MRVQGSYRSRLLVIFIVCLAASLIRAPASNLDLLLHHAPVVIFLFWLCTGWRPGALDDRALTLTFLFLMVHVVGARYLYSEVPYDRVVEAIFGRDLTGTLGLSRNHYDRFVHFSFGLFMLRPAIQLLRHNVSTSPLMLIGLAIGLIVVAGTIYEILEWGVAVMFSPETADRYNGQQGDLWDPQKDMLLALVGALIASVPEAARSRRTEPVPDES